MPDGAAVLQVEGLVAGYGGSTVLAGIDLEVSRGSVMAVLGRNGMGKSTLMRALMGLLPASAGSVRFEGRETTGLKPYQISNLGMAYVPQGREIFAGFTVEENLLMGLLGKPGRGDIPDDVYDYFPVLAERRGQRADSMSGGEQQQLAIARALVGKPKILLLDEPSEGIQPSIVEAIAETLGEIAKHEGLTVLLVEQNVDMVLDLAERCAFIENGRVVARHDIDELRASDDILRRYLAV
jgi:branched-chain amino acid transport system ATP-binding protein/urea transport system ATP-binding protein